MEKCPFWSANGKFEVCDKECPMSKGNEECVFQLCASDTLVIDEDDE